MEQKPQVEVEDVGDIVLLLHMMKKMGVSEVIDRHIPRHWKQEGLDWGWVATIWLARIISQGDHRKLPVRQWVKQTQRTLEHATGVKLGETDFTDDRLGIVLTHLSKPEVWQGIERELSARTVRVYDLSQETVRVDMTTVSGHHDGAGGTLMQFGHSKDDPTLRQLKVALATLDPLGWVVASSVVAGDRADDPLYVPLIERVTETLQRKALLFVGDCKMAALQTRAYLAQGEQFYLMPLPATGETQDRLPHWIAEGLVRQGAGQLTAVYAKADPTEVIAEGYEFTRARDTQSEGQHTQWQERVLVVRSAAHAAHVRDRLRHNLDAATTALRALTPAPGRGKRQITEEATLTQHIAAVLARYEVSGLLTCACERQVERRHQCVGRGRRGPHRPTHSVERVRYQITTITRDEDAVAAQLNAAGWRAFATTAPAPRLTLGQAVQTYRDEFVIEQRGFARLKGASVAIAPLFVKTDDQITGLTHLLTLAVSVLNLIEFVARRNLYESRSALLGLHPENPRKATPVPTAERLLRAFNLVRLVIMRVGDHCAYHLTPLSELHCHILAVLGLSSDIYLSLADDFINSS
jgi:transposase